MKVEVAMLWISVITAHGVAVVATDIIRGEYLFESPQLWESGVDILLWVDEFVDITETGAKVLWYAGLIARNGTGMTGSRIL